MPRYNLLFIGIFTSLGLALLFSFSVALDAHFEQQDQMLCNSAKISSNEEYLKKCGCFYAGGDIRCIYGGKK